MPGLPAGSWVVGICPIRMWHAVGPVIQRSCTPAATQLDPDVSLEVGANSAAQTPKLELAVQHRQTQSERDKDDNQQTVTTVTTAAEPAVADDMRHT